MYARCCVDVNDMHGVVLTLMICRNKVCNMSSSERTEEYTMAK